MRVLFDATTALAWARRPPVGTVRVERLILGELLRRLPEGDLQLVKFRAGRFVPVTDAQAALARAAALGLEPPPDPPRRAGWRRWLKGARHPRRSRSGVDFSGFTDLVTVGHGWDYLGHDELAGLRRRHGVRVHGFVHDLVAVDHPHFYHDPAQADRLRRHHAALCGLADVLVANSRATRAGLERFIARENLRRPELRVAPLAGWLAATAPASPPAVGQEPFALYVSTLEIRKNHRLLLRLWSEGARTGLALPRLVLVGRAGWGIDEALRMLRHDPALQGRVLWLENLPDAALADLYRNCLFTLYPSYAEGWGLPISESLAFGKICLHADDPAQHEAAQGLGLTCHPDDLPGWRAEILSLAHDPDRRAALEAAIRERYRPRTAAAFCADVAAAFGLP